MKTKLHILEDKSKTMFSERLSNIMSLFDADQIIHVEFMTRSSSLNAIIYVAHIFVRED